MFRLQKKPLTAEAAGTPVKPAAVPAAFFGTRVERVETDDHDRPVDEEPDTDERRVINPENLERPTVKPWTFRASHTTFPSVKEEMAKFLYEYGVDALFTDNPDQVPRR